MRMPLETPSTYVLLESSSMSETEFLREVTGRTGCGLLLDVNNVYVSATNHGFDPMSYLTQFPVERAGEVHLAGFAADRDSSGRPLPIDAHGTRVSEVVWSLYRCAFGLIGPIPTLIEWDNDVPPFPVSSGEVARAQAALAEQAVRRQRAIAGVMRVPRAVAR